MGDAERLKAGRAAVHEAVAIGAVHVNQARIIGRTVETLRQEAGAAAADKAVGLLLDWAGGCSPAPSGALVLRDGDCAFPGCDRPPRLCAGHHVRHCSAGGCGVGGSQGA